MNKTERKREERRFWNTDSYFWEKERDKLKNNSATASRDAKEYVTLNYPFTHRPFYTQTLLHTDAFTHRCLHTQLKSQFYLSFWHSNLVLCVKGSSGTLEIAILPQFLTLEPRFVRKGWRFHSARLKSQFYLSFWHSNLVLCVKGSSGTLEIVILPQFLTLEPRFVREGFIRHTCNRNFTTVLDTRTSFRA